MVKPSGDWPVKNPALWIEPKQGHVRLLEIIKLSRSLEGYLRQLERKVGVTAKSRNGTSRYRAGWEMAETVLAQGSDPDVRRLAKQYREFFKRYYHRVLKLTQDFRPWIEFYAQKVANIVGGFPEDYFPQLESAFEQGLARLREPNYHYLRQWIAQKAQRLIQSIENKTESARWFCPLQGTLLTAETSKSARRLAGCKQCKRAPECQGPQKIRELGSVRNVSLELFVFESSRETDEEALGRVAKNGDPESQFISGFVEGYDPTEKDHRKIAEYIYHFPLDNRLKGLSVCFYCLLTDGACPEGLGRLKDSRSVLSLLVSFAKAQTWIRKIPQNLSINCPGRKSHGDTRRNLQEENR